MNTEPLRILVIVSRPLAQLVPVEHGGQQFEAVSPVPLEPVEAVRDGLRQIFLDDETPARVRYLPWTRLGDLQAALAEPYDVVHFVGHGAEEGRLLLEAENGAADLVSPQRLAEAMRDAGVRLALLSACHSGAAGLGLHEAGIPNVAMVDERYPMAAEAAALFNRQFYVRLARGRRPLEAFEAGVRAVRMDRHFGDEAPPPRNDYTGEIQPRYGERFDKIIADDRPLVDGVPTAGYEELRPSRARCAVTREEVFVGREAKMIEIIRQMQTARLVTLTGPGGIGKTALGRRVALWHSERLVLRDGVIEVNLENVHDDGELVSQLAYALDVELDPRRPWDTIRGALSGRWLVLLDSAEGLTPEAIEYLGEPLLGRLEELHLLVTSHASLHLVKYEQPVEVEQLLVGRGNWIGPAEWMFISYTPQRRQVHIVCQHFDTVRNICCELDGYPLGILLEAAQLSDERETPERLLDALRANMVEALRYSRAAGLPDRHKSVGAAMKGSHDKLGAAAKQLLAHIAVFPGGVGEEMLKALEGLDEAQWKGTEREVRELGLVRWEEDRYRMLPPIRAWAQTTLPTDELDAYRLRAVRSLADRAEMWDSMLGAGEERRAFAVEMAQKAGQQVEHVERVLMQSALATFDRERENLLAAMDWAYNAPDWPLVTRLAENQYKWQDIRSFWPDSEHCSLLAVAAAEQGRDRRQLGAALDRLATVYLLQGKWSEAGDTYERALVIARELGERGRQGEGATLNNLGNVYRLQGRWNEAIERYEKALGIARQLGDKHGEGLTLGSLGEVYTAQGRSDEAIDKLKDALRIFRELGDRKGEGMALLGLGNVYVGQGRGDDAMDKFRDALRIYRELGNRDGEGTALMNLGIVHARQRAWEEAVECLEESLRINRELGDRHGEAQALTNLARLLHARGEHEEALRHAEEAGPILEVLGDVVGLVTWHHLLALIYRALGELAASFDSLAAGLELALRIHPRSVVEMLDAIVHTTKEIGEEGRWQEVAGLGARLFRTVVEMEIEGWRSEEMEDFGVFALARRVCVVISLVGKSRLLGEVPEEERTEAGQTALAMARMVDEGTGGRWELEGWVRELLTDEG